MKPGIFMILSFVLVSCGAPLPPVGHFKSIVEQDVSVQDSSDIMSEDTQKDKETQTVAKKLNIGGIWAFMDVTANCEFVFSKGFEVLTYSFGVMKVVPIDRYQFKEVRTTCMLKETPLLGQESMYTKGLIDAINPTIIYAMVDGFESGATYLQAPYVDLWGIKLKDPWHDPIPDSKIDPRIFDFDNDGKPGVTLHVGSMCDVYLVQRSITTVVGRVESSILIKAKKSSHADVFRIGATDQVCMSKNKDVPMPEYSYLILKRVDGLDGSINLDDNHDKRIDCNELKRHLKELQFIPPHANNKHCSGFGGK